MLMQRRRAAKAVATTLYATEQAVDAALQSCSKLCSDMITARGTANLSALFGQDALEDATALQVALTEARRKVVETHKKLAIVHQEIGLGVYAGGDGSPKPPLPGFTEAHDNDAVAA
jgi:hypothetical protein